MLTDCSRIGSVMNYRSSRYQMRCAVARIVMNSLMACDQRLSGHHLVARRAGRKIIEAECVHAPCVLDRELCCSQIAAEIVEAWQPVS